MKELSSGVGVEGLLGQVHSTQREWLNPCSPVASGVSVGEMSSRKACAVVETATGGWTDSRET